MRRFALLTIMVLVGILAYGQIINPVKWQTSARKIDDQTTELVFKAAISAPWHMYGVNIPEGGPIATSIIFDSTANFVAVGETGQNPEPEIVDDQIFNMPVELHNGDVTFTQKIKNISGKGFTASGTVEYMTCSDMQCIPGNYDFSFNIDEKGEPVAGAVQTPVKSSDGGSLLNTLLLAVIAGLGGLLTPCVYPMIPLTVSYFIRKKQKKSGAILQAVIFGLSIVLIYTLIGVLVSVFKNPNAVNNVTTHWSVNLIFFFIFIALSLSFFGMYEITLPSGLANKVDRQADKGGYAGAFFMALAMVILSFSCTGPIVASLLIKASAGVVIEPAVGMAAFSLVFALPFTFFAVFPSLLEKLPRSGSWLNAVKVFFAFIMLAFAFYFLSKIDQVYHLNILSRELFLSIWIVIFISMGLYFLGIIRLAHDSATAPVSVPRFITGMASLSFAVYLSTGLMGHTFKALESILPPPVTQKTDTELAVPNSFGARFQFSSTCSSPLYSDFLSLPLGLEGYFDYDQALACAAQQGKPVFVDFAGHTCSNCKKMYAEVWSDPRVLEKLRNDFVMVALYTDDKTRLPENKQVTSHIDGKVKNTIGKLNQDIQIENFNSNALPLYAIIDANGKSLTHDYYTYNTDIQNFLDWLDEGSGAAQAGR
jgi:thiol:disulfide interchange protein